MLDYLSGAPAGQVLGAGVAYLLAARRRSRRASALALVGVVWLLALYFYDVLLAPIAIRQILYMRAGTGPSAVATQLKVYTVVYALLYAGAVAVLIYAVMTDRRTPPVADD
jgi:hypothetical protein